MPGLNLAPSEHLNGEDHLTWACCEQAGSSIREIFKRVVAGNEYMNTFNTTIDNLRIFQKFHGIQKEHSKIIEISVDLKTLILVAPATPPAAKANIYKVL